MHSSVIAERSEGSAVAFDSFQVALLPNCRPLGQDRKFLRKAVLWMRQLLGILG
jgi:hypothetical protein